MATMPLMLRLTPWAAPRPSRRRDRAAPARIARLADGERTRARRLQHRDAAPVHEEHEDHAGDEAADMRPEGDAAGARIGALRAQELHQEPEAEQQDRRHGDDAENDDDPTEDEDVAERI